MKTGINNRMTLQENLWNRKDYEWFRAVILKNNRIERIDSILGTKKVKHSKDDGTPQINDFQIGKHRHIYDMSKMIYYGRVPIGFFEKDIPGQLDGPPRWVAPAILSSELDDLLRTAWIQPVFKGSGWIQKLLMSGKYSLIITGITLVIVIMIAMGWI